MSPRVTVLLPVHDGEPWVRGAIESVLAQTYREFELLIVDDASTDGTAATIASFDDPRIRVLRNERNLGLVPSLNRGLREARGELVARIDADDRCLPARLERQVAALDREPRVALVGSWLELLDERGRRVGKVTERLDDRISFVFRSLSMRVCITHPAATYRRAPVLEVGGYDEATFLAEDKDLWRRLLLAGWDARVVPEPLLAYRLHDAQISQTHVDAQRQVDGESQERFLAELAPGVAVRAARLALADDPVFWRERRDVGELLQGLGAVVDGARRRLELDGREAASLEQLTATRLLRVARRRPWRREAMALAAWSLNRIASERRVAAATAYGLSFPVAPLRLGAARGTRALARLPAADAARRSHAARKVYAKVLGGN